MKKAFKILNEDLPSMAIALQALIGTIAIVGAAALLLRLATGNW
ncbi:MAG TPA: hypothetical protein VJS43_16705 [Candidatus Acidoferrales bacterium]|nr:hypothetical protein [Candidatus Acidoferrales bacterium]